MVTIIETDGIVDGINGINLEDKNSESNEILTNGTSVVVPVFELEPKFNELIFEEDIKNIPEILDKSEEDKLTMDILMLFDAITPTVQNYELRKKLNDKLQALLNKVYPEAEVEAYLFGSSENTLGSISSDVDICLLTPWDGFNDLNLLAETLTENGYKVISCITEAKVPVIKAWDPVLRLAFDVNVNNPLALDNTNLLKTYAAIDPRVRPFAVAIKYWTKQRLLNDAAAGGTLSTYAWVNLIFNFLQTRKPPILPTLHSIPCQPMYKSGVNVAFFTNVELLRGFGHPNKETLGGLMYSFFRRYAYEFNYESEVVSLRGGYITTKENKGWIGAKGNHFFCIEEPFNIDRNLGNSCDEISLIGLKQEFQRACLLLAKRSSLSLMCLPYFYEDSESEDEAKKDASSLNSKTDLTIDSELRDKRSKPLSYLQALTLNSKLVVDEELSKPIVNFNLKNPAVSSRSNIAKKTSENSSATRSGKSNRKNSSKSREPNSKSRGGGNDKRAGARSKAKKASTPVSDDGFKPVVTKRKLNLKSDVVEVLKVDSAT